MVNPGMARPWRLIAIFGGAIAILLALTLVAMLWNDRTSRLQAAQRQGMALATGSDRLLRSELTTVERALRGTARDGREYYRHAKEQAPALLQASIQGVLERNSDLAAITLVDDAGQPLSAGKGDPTLHDWVIPKNRVLAGELYVGGLEREPGNESLLKTAVPVQPGQWLLARVRLGAFQEVVTGLDTGRHGVVSILTRDGQLLAHSQRPEAVQRPLPRPVGRFAPADRVQPLGVAASPMDGVRRVGAVSVPRDYPLMLFAGLSYEEVMMPWRTYRNLAVGIYMLYLAGFLYLLQSVYRSSQQQARLAEKLRAGSAELTLAHEVGKVGTWSIDNDGLSLHWSALTRRMFALRTSHATLEEFYTHVHREDQVWLRPQLQAALEKGGAVNALFRLLLEDGSTRWLSARGERVDSINQRQRMAGALVDVSERVNSEARARRAERQFQLVFDRNPMPFWIYDLATLRFLEVNQAATSQYGYSRAEFLSSSILDIYPLDERAGIHRMIERVRQGAVLEAEMWTHQRKDGSIFSVRIHVAQLEFDGVPACLVLAEDVSDQVAYERELAYRASHHPGTGLLNVRALAEVLDASTGGYTIAHVQLHGLQMINDALGREAGEEVLRAVASRLGGLGARYGLLAYQPAEEFVLAITGDHDPKRALDALLEVVSEPVRGRDFFHQLEPRIGVAACPADGELAEQVIGKAAQAAHAGRGDGAVMSRFDDEVAARLSARLQLAGRLHVAIEAGEFELYFQPIRHAVDGSPAALEALLRWPQADGSFIAPGDFIQLCEDTGLIIGLGRWVIDAAAKAQQQLCAQGWGHLPIAVNISAVQFFNCDLVGEFTRATQAYGLQRGALQLELTESSLMRNPAQALQTMQQLHREGICVSLDDFGTGFSSMSYLQHLPLDSLKIDRCFVNDVETNPRNAAICRALLSLGHSMGLVVIAEGVETEGQHAWLAAHGCDQVQGYLLGRPMPLPALIELLGPAAAR